jgi:hypothetical protein
MAVKIPEYQSRLTPSGFQPANGQIAQIVDNSGAGLQKAGATLMEFGIKEAQEEAKKADQDDWLRAQTALLQGHQDLTQYVTDLSQAQEPGAAGFTDKIRENVRSYSTKLLEQGGWRENTKRLLQGKLLDLESSFVGSAMQFEAKAGVDLRLGQIDKNTTFYQQQLIANPENYEAIMGGIDSMIDNAAIGPQLKQKLKADYRKNIAVSTIQAIKEKDPEVAKRLLETIYSSGQADQFADLQADPNTLPEFGERPDGTKKGTGWLGVLRRPDGGVSTEISISTDAIGGKDFPLLAPTLTRKEVDAILAIPVDDPKFFEKVPKSAIVKAEKFAIARAADGLSPFAGPSDSHNTGEAITTPYNQTAAPAGVEPIVFPEGVKLPAGLRNNNPGNIKYVGQKDSTGPSKNTDQGDPQAVYATPEDGLNAMYKLVLKKFDGGKTTVSDMIAGRGGWTPGNNQAAANIARTMGVGPNDQLDLRDPNVLTKFARALITQEHGAANKYINDNQLAAGASKALGGGSMTGSTGTAATDSAAPTMAPGVGVTPRAEAELPAWGKRIIQDIDPDKIPTLIASAEADINRLRTQFKAEVITREANDISMFEDGRTPPQELTLAEYQKAFGDEEGAIRFQNYQGVRVLGNDKMAVRTMSNEQQDKLLEKYAPDPNRPEFYEAAKKRQAYLAQAINDVRTERNKDPISFAIKNNIGNLQPIDWNDMAAAGAELGKRYGVSLEMNKSFGTPFTVLTPDEKTRMLEGFSKLTDQGKIAFLSTLNTNLSNKSVYRSIVQQIAPDSPVTAVVGNLVGLSGTATFRTDNYIRADEVRTYDPKVVALTIMQGEQLLNPSKGTKATDGAGKSIKMPKEDDMRAAFHDEVGESFTHQAREYDVTYQAVKAYYAAKSAASGNFMQESVDRKLWNEAIEAVTGGVTEINGKTQVRRPWGMSETAFNDGIKAAFDNETKRLGLNWNFNQYGLENAGDGYLVRAGTGYATYQDKNGNLRSVYITIGGPSPKSDALPSAAPGAKDKVEVNKTQKLGTK